MVKKSLAVVFVLGFAVLALAMFQQPGSRLSNTVLVDSNGAQFVRQYNPNSGNDPCANPDVAKSSAKISLTGTTAVELVPASGSKVVYVCGFSATIQGSTTVGTLQFETGTKTANPCDTATATLTDTFQGNTNASVPILVTSAGGGFTQFPGFAGGEMCAVATGSTISVRGYVTYVQQ